MATKMLITNLGTMLYASIELIRRLFERILYEESNHCELCNHCETNLNRQKNAYLELLHSDYH